MKRFLDIFLSIIGLAFGGPLVVIFGILIRLESKGPVFYKQVRTSKNGKPFVIYKLRSMGVGAEKNGLKWAEKNDVRITKVGKFIRKTKIDEIPQFFNILNGDMSIVGPRPERPSFIALFQSQIPNYVKRLQVKPGLTGWAQVNGGYELSAGEKLVFDLDYIKHQSLWLDMKIFFKTFSVLVNYKGSW
jgi:lipopolysaccharide/colanic/teichoic acid biosynthesis glycosyltransferase